MPAELKLHYVAFLDLLGFKEMVHADLGTENNPNLIKLFRCHQSAAKIFADDPQSSITQFSDSIVVSKPYDAAEFETFANRVAQYQRLLLDEELICRGGIAVGKHFSNGSFTFSAGLIEAYHVESKAARYPRVVISPELLDLVYPARKTIPNFLVEEDDGLLFIDYIGLTLSVRPKKMERAVNNVVAKLLASNQPSVREKGLWMATYSDATLRSSLKSPKFKGRRIQT